VLVLEKGSRLNSTLRRQKRPMIPPASCPYSQTPSPSGGLALLLSRSATHARVRGHGVVRDGNPVDPRNEPMRAR
jgi:hypothetical protein